MRLLLDTCAFLWMIGDERRLSPRAREAILDPAAAIYLSAASSWEIAIKVKMGKLSLPQPAELLVPAQMARNAIAPLAVEHAHALATLSLPWHHRDPFDRLLVAQARLEKLSVVTPDEAFSPYGVPTLW